ncbi:MAG: MCE family protein [Xanthomonadales bacterium]|nr:MCE family protein [Gammaproteobacteria bacterium]NNK51883.1 MCE family protein [Xanthomonadales bacterium]
MISKSSYALTGAFVLVLGTIFIWGVLWISAGGPPQNFQRYLVYMTDSVSGLNVDSAVRFRGVDVGKVEQISIDPKNSGRVRLQLLIRQGTPITIETVANLEYQGLTGLASVNLGGGHADSKVLTRAEGEEYPVIQARSTLFSSLDLTLSDLLDNLIETSAGINDLLNEENRANVSRSIENVAGVTEKFLEQSQQLDAVIENLSATLENTRAASVGFPALVQDFSASAQAITRMADQINTVGERLASASAGIDQAANQTADDLAAFTGTTVPEIHALVSELRLAAENLRRMSDALAQDPSILLYGTPERQPGPGE